MLVIVVLTAVLVAAVSAHPGHRAPTSPISWDTSEPARVQSANVHSLVGASFHAIHASL
jgi:hypothetical protein